ncbi:SMP-30/gluconolactonase/LRE family protein [Bradyrhizobium sp. 5.13L]
MKEQLRRVGTVTIAIMRCLLLISCLICAFASSLAVARERLSSRFCVVPIRGGTPTEKDFNDAWRMVSKVIMLPGVPRPVIYAFNRGNVWTIDESRALIPFGGEFPSNPIHDQIARDPESGRLIGVNSALGIFAIDPGQTQFRKLYGLSDTPLRHPNSVEFIPRFKGFVISDHSGLYLLDRTGALSHLRVSDPATLGAPARVFDLPAFDALVVNAQNSSAVVRYDDGEVIHVATLDRFDFVRGANVEADGSVAIHGTGRHTPFA